MAELEDILEENDEDIISGMSEFFFVQHHPCEQANWWLSLVKKLKHSELHTGFSIAYFED